MTTATAACTMVATAELIEAAFPGQRRTNSGVMSAEFPVYPTACKTAFGRWLAERVRTTRRDDDLSILRVTTRHTEADLTVSEFLGRVTQSRISSADEFERTLSQLERWVGKQRRLAAVYGEAMFSRRVIAFDWPVMGSRAAEHITDPAAYFDLCAARIRAMKPAAVCLMDGQEPPASLQVCV